MSQHTAEGSQLLLDATGARVADARRSGPRNLAPTPALGAVPAIRTAFERFELKYWVTEPLAQRVLDFALPYLKRDAHATTREAQRNTSMYLDTRGFRFCENHMNLSPDRSKLRIRAYGRPYSKLAFFELKRKVKTVTMKERFALPIAEVENVLLRRPVGCEMSEAARRTMGDFLLQMCLHRAEPKLFVACYREAFESRIPGEDVRMTIDRELVYQQTRRLTASRPTSNAGGTSRRATTRAPPSVTVERCSSSSSTARRRAGWSSWSVTSICSVKRFRNTRPQHCNCVGDFSHGYARRLGYRSRIAALVVRNVDDHRHRVHHHVSRYRLSTQLRADHRARRPGRLLGHVGHRR